MRLPKLDERLSRAAALFPACDYGADIGADHGRLSCCLLANQVCRRMCVADLSADSLEKARKLLSLHGLTDRADMAVGDGLDVLTKPADVIAILGMGGRTVSGILRRGKEKLFDARLILSAHTDIPFLRGTLAEMGYRIEREEIALAAGRFYVLIRAEKGREALTDRQLFLGPRLMEGCAEHYREYLSRQMDVLKRGRTEESKQRTEWIGEEWSRVGDGQAD